jgi:glycosyltransferase EpsD
MKILFVTTISNTVNAFLIPHIRMLMDQGHQIEVAFNIVQEVSPELIELGCKIHLIEFQRSPLKKQNYSAYKRLKQIIINEQFDLVHTHTPVASACVRLACKNLDNVKILYTAHGFHFYKGAPITNWSIFYPIEKYLARYTDCLITINNEDFRRASHSLKAKSIKQVNGVGIDLNKFSSRSIELKNKLREEYNFKETDFILLCVGELNHNKHQDLLIHAVARLKNLNLKLLLAGEGELLETYRDQSKKLGLDNNVLLLGYRKDIANLMAISDVVVSSSKREGLPVNLMEAMATGLPIIATNCRGNIDLVRHNHNGYIVEADDIEGYSNAIMKLYNSEKLRKEFGKKSSEFIKKYSLKSVMEEMNRIYNDFLKGRKQLLSEQQGYHTQKGSRSI